jgi:hypothetical protein
MDFIKKESGKTYFHNKSPFSQRGFVVFSVINYGFVDQMLAFL